MQLAKRISPSMEIGPLSAPYLLVPVLAMAQIVNVSRSGEEPDPTGSVLEDMRIFDRALNDDAGELLARASLNLQCCASFKPKKKPFRP